MKKSILAFLFVFSITGVEAQTPQRFLMAKTAEEVGFSSEKLKRIDTLEQGFIANGIAPNAVTFVARYGKIVHFKTFGYSNLKLKTPLKKDDIFKIASQTKLLTKLLACCY